MLRSPYDRRIFALAVPALGALAAEPLYLLVDTAIVGHLGTTELAALAIAAFSFFLGQQDEFPAAWRGLAIWFVPPLAVLAAMAFWLVRVRFTAAFGRPAPNRRSAYQS